MIHGMVGGAHWLQKGQDAGIGRLTSAPGPWGQACGPSMGASETRSEEKGGKGGASKSMCVLQVWVDALKESHGKLSTAHVHR